MLISQIKRGTLLKRWSQHWQIIVHHSPSSSQLWMMLWMMDGAPGWCWILWKVVDERSSVERSPSLTVGLPSLSSPVTAKHQHFEPGLHSSASYYYYYYSYYFYRYHNFCKAPTSWLCIHPTFFYYFHLILLLLRPQQSKAPSFWLGPPSSCLQLERIYQRTWTWQEALDKILETTMWFACIIVFHGIEYICVFHICPFAGMVSKYSKRSVGDPRCWREVFGRRSVGVGPCFTNVSIHYELSAGREARHWETFKCSCP